MAETIETYHKMLEDKLNETRILMSVSQIANSTLELKTILDMICKTVADSLMKDMCSIYLLRSGGKMICIEATKGLKEDSVGIACLPVGEGIVGWVVKELQPLIVEDIRKEPRFKDIPTIGAKDFLSMLAVPILRDNEPIGVMTLQTREPYAYSPDEVNLLTIISNNISAVIKNAELYRNTKTQLDELRTIHEIGKAITSILNIDELLPYICREVSKLLNAKGCVIRLIEDETLPIKASYGVPKEIEQAMAIPLGEGIAGWVAKEGKPLLVDDVSKMPENLRIPVIDATTVLCVPLKIGRRVIGTIGLYNKMDELGYTIFTQNDLNSLTTFASVSSIAIENARLYKTTVEKERTISQAKQRFETLFNSVQDGIITFGRDLIIKTANRFMEKLIDTPLKEIIGKSCYEVLPPQCPAKVTFETGQPESYTYKRVVKGTTFYIEATTYPIIDDKGEINEVVALIHDITERMTYQEEILELYREVAQTKEYLESLIDNSADAIITSDIDGYITSWNNGAERIYGFTEIEAIGKLLPMVPKSLLDSEKKNIKKIKHGETIKDIESLRQRKDGTPIEVSLTLSPILDPTGNVIGISGISRDISAKKRVEKELIRRSQELSRFHLIDSALRSTLDLDKLLRMILTAVTMSDGFGFNRAILFLVNEEQNILRGVMGVGPASHEEAGKIWREISINGKTLEDIINEIEIGPLRKDSFLDRLSQNLVISLDGKNVLSLCIKEKKFFNILNARTDPMVEPALIQQLGTEAFAVVPLMAKDKAIGLIFVDNLFNKRPIKEDDLQFLMSFTSHVASAIENARLFEEVSLAQSELKNIFESISDMVYFNDKDFNIHHINQAVIKKLGKTADEIIGKKCYQVFHGMDEPWSRCPHSKTINTGKPFVEELEDPNLGGIFVVSSSPIFDSAGNITGTVHISRDITELHALRERLVSTERMAALGEMAAKVAHEIRNPLTSVGGFARRLEKKVDGDLKEYTKIIIEEVNRLENILRDTIDFVKEARVIKRKTDLNELLGNIISLINLGVIEKGNTLIKDLPEYPIIAFVDPDRVKEAILNILTNANQATDAGMITVRARQMGEEVVIEILDTGCGIKQDDLKRIFDPFFTTRTTGTGLGLAITSRIIGEHKGKIDVESIWGAGTKFTIYLPLKEV